MTHWPEVLESVYGASSESSLFTDEFPAVRFPPATEEKTVIQPPRVSPVAAAVGAVAVLGIIAGGWLILAGLDSGANVEALNPAQVACESSVIADLVSPEGVVVAFQRAYAAGDADSVVKTLSEESPLRETDWEETLAGQSSQACVSIETSSLATVTATTSFVSGVETTVYHQRFSLKVSDSGPRIESIVDVKGSA